MCKWTFGLRVGLPLFFTSNKISSGTTETFPSLAYDYVLDSPFFMVFFEEKGDVKR